MIFIPLDLLLDNHDNRMNLHGLWTVLANFMGIRWYTMSFQVPFS